MQYSLQRAREGYALRYDSVMINTGTEMKMSTITDPFFPGILPCPQTDSNFAQVFEKPVQNPKNATNPDTQPSKPPKSSIAAQRERTKELRLEDIRPYFNVPIKVASGKMNICETVLKRIRRENGLTRWPYRKIKQADQKIATLEGMLRDGNGEDAESIKNEIAMLQNQLAQYYCLSPRHTL
ncbi:hypothetical protein SUGI_0647240 [Cryptomeria japonica]|nr:hypothetical protein SUGI_0647240 [Cryptomeria japonica]